MKVAIAHVCMGFGGSEAAAMWAIEALKHVNDVSLLTAGDPDLACLNAFYGTSVRSGDVCVRRVPAVFRCLGCGDALQAGLFQRFCRGLARDFDLLVSAYNPLDFGVPAIHFVGDFSWQRDLREQLDPIPREAQRVIHRDGWVREAYLALGRRLGRPSGRNLLAGEDLLVANSEFTAGLLHTRLGVSDVPVVYPPVGNAAHRTPFSERERGFVCLGRVAHEKRIERIIRVLGRVRSLGHDVHLHVVGAMPNTPYGGLVRRLCYENRTWVFADGERAGSAKWELLSSHRFGIHARPGEAFGIAVAEMAKAGCVTFVPAYGAPSEILGDDRLCYDDEDDAVRKIDRLLRDDGQQERISANLVRRSERFSAERFMADFRSIVNEFISRVSRSRRAPTVDTRHRKAIR